MRGWGRFRLVIIYVNIYTATICFTFCIGAKINIPKSVTYPGRLGDRYTGLGAQTPVPKRHFSNFFFSVVFQQKNVEVVTKVFYSAFNYFELA